ncbi:phage tail protein [Microbulbifer sp. ALW1]|uniref:phage tail protein n=1 Tax=Microbulbifer sp. (strain ALW1) TaxID=1516059 RepID=UPI001357E2A2|nr:phage tail protein [Microbulbifer sp. ALW1]
MISIKDDLNLLDRKVGKMAQGLVARAAGPAMNRAVKSVNSEAIKQVAAETSVKQKDIRQAHKLYLARRDRLQASIDAAKARARNLIEYVRPAQRKAGHFNSRSTRGKFKAPGVKAKAWGKSKTYAGTFIARAPQGQLLVFARKGPGRLPLKGVVGPSPRGTFVSQRLIEVMERKARERVPIELTRSITNELRKLK